MGLKKSVATTLALLSLLACQTPVFKGDAGVLSIRTLHQTQYSHFSLPQSVVIRNEARMQQLWDQQTQDGFSRPKVDFSRDMVVAVMLGERPNGCYSVTIDNIRANADKLVVEYTEHTPGVGAFCTYSFTSPAHYVVMPQDARPVEFLKFKE